VPRDPETRRKNKRDEPYPSDEVAQALVAHDRPVKRLVRKKRQAGEAGADRDRLERSECPGHVARCDRSHREGDDREMCGEPRQARPGRFEHPGRERRPHLMGVEGNGT